MNVLMTTKTAAERLGVSPRHILYLRATGKIEGQKIGTSWAFWEENVEALRKVREKQR